MDFSSFKNQTTWIIGASSGIGEALAREIARDGGKLALSARSVDKLRIICDELGQGHKPYPLDVSDPKALQEAAQSIQKDFGKIDRVVFLAALYDPLEFKNIKAEAVNKIVDVNLKGAFYTVEAVLPVIEEQGSGQIALCGSVAGFCGLPKGQPYSATKAAINNMAQSLRAEMQGDHIDIKVINPGFVRTPLTDKNKFDMPMIIEAEDAAKALAYGLRTRKYEVHFPKKFTILVKLLALLPYSLYFALAKRIERP